jgi:hypothetical protein
MLHMKGVCLGSHSPLSLLLRLVFRIETEMLAQCARKQGVRRASWAALGNNAYTCLNIFVKLVMLLCTRAPSFL